MADTHVPARGRPYPVMPASELSRMIREDAERATAGGPGYRKPVHACPANPTPDHKVAFALGSLIYAARDAIGEGATLEELISTMDQAWSSRGSR